MESLRPWLAAARPGQALLAPLCAAVGSTYAHFDAQRGPGLSAHVVVTLAALAAAVGVNLIDHAWIRLGTPPPDPKLPPPPGPEPIDARDAAAAGGAALLLAALCGIGLGSLSGAAALGYGMVAVVLGVARGAPAVGLDTLGWRLGDVANALALGPVAAMAGYASQAGSGSAGAFLAGVPSGLVAAAALFGRRVIDDDIDADVARGIAVALPLVAAAAISIAARSGEYGPWAHVAGLPLVFAAGASWRFPPKPSEGDAAGSERLALSCAAAALACIIVSLGIATPE